MTCAHHGPEACCTRCTEATDGTGFPHPSEAKGRTRLQRCSGCLDWVRLEAWVHDIAAARFGCLCCCPDPPMARPNAVRRRRRGTLGAARGGASGLRAIPMRTPRPGLPPQPSTIYLLDPDDITVTGDVA